MYKFETCSKEIVNKFSDNNPKGHIFQTTLWCDFKSEWEQHYIVGKKKKDVVLTCSLLTRKIPYLNKKIGYIPRGFVADYSNVTLVKCFAEFLKKYTVENDISFVTIDPDIHLKENESEVKDGYLVKDILEDAGFKFADSNGKNFEAIQPKFAFRLDISKQEGESVEQTKKRVFSNFHSKWRYNIKLGSQRCLEVEWFDSKNITEEAIDEFQRLMDITGKRDNFLVRKRAYFENLIKNVDPGSRLYLVKYNIDKDLTDSNSKLAKLEKEKANLEAKIASFIKKLENETEDKIGEKQLKAHLKDTKKSDDLTGQITRLKERIDRLNEFVNETGKRSLYLSGAIYLFHSNKAWYLYGASSNDFRETMPNFSMQWAMICDSIDINKDIYDFRGVSGDLDESNPLYGLYKFKKGFNGDFVEFLGEADLINNKLVYKMFKEVFPRYKKIRAKLRNK